MRFLALYVVSFVVLVGGGAVLGFVLRHWALAVPPLLAAALAYAWEFDRTGVVYAVIAAVLAAAGVVSGVLLRSPWRREAA